MFLLGSLVTDIYTKMLQKKDGNLKPNRSLFIYSGHDVTLVNVMNAMNIIAQTSRKPDFCAALYFELHENPILEDLEIKVFNSPYLARDLKTFNLICYCSSLQIFYSLSSYATDLKPISIPNCDAPCSLTQFGKAIQHIYVHDYDKQCEKTSQTKESTEL